MQQVEYFSWPRAMAAGMLSLLIAMPLPATAQTGKAKSGPTPEDVKAGGQKATQCFACHGVDGIATMPDTPNLAGQNYNYLVKALKEYKTGIRKNEVMAPMARNLSDRDIEQIAAYYSHIKVAAQAPKK